MRAFVCTTARSNASISVRYYGAGDVPGGSSSFKSRERASEAKAMADRDRELLEKLKKKLLAERSPENDQHVEVIQKLQSAIHDIKLPDDVIEKAKEEKITTEDFLELRKDLMARVRELEDDLAALKVKKKN